MARNCPQPRRVPVQLALAAGDDEHEVEDEATLPMANDADADAMEAADPYMTETWHPTDVPEDF